ncbi:hypothetical protein cyc_07990 [Cyclospora cayetanensis]|uniref:Uncharacterized protein n=1 Tax=Cyclospora cayetanensis TaxID=88456 RepID=A0A1D3D1J9_9EIME|nr:hypothetical protein cyc_07990 [Cyclospora cayetanensis]
MGKAPLPLVQGEACGGLADPLLLNTQFFGYCRENPSHCSRQKSSRNEEMLQYEGGKPSCCIALCPFNGDAHEDSSHIDQCSPHHACWSGRGKTRCFSVLRDPKPLHRVLAELEAAEKVKGQDSSRGSNAESTFISERASTRASSVEWSAVATNSSPCNSGHSSARMPFYDEDSTASDSFLDCRDGETIETVEAQSPLPSLGFGGDSSSSTARSSSGGDSWGGSTAPPPFQALHASAEIVASQEQLEALAAEEASTAAAAFSQRQRELLDCVAAAAAGEGGIRGALQQSFEDLLPPHISAAAATGAGGASNGDGRPLGSDAEADDALLTPAQRFYRDNRELLLQRAEQYLLGKQAAAAAAAATATDPEGAEEEEWGGAASALEEDWRAYFNPVYKPPKGFSWPVGGGTSEADGQTKVAAAAASSAPPVYVSCTHARQQPPSTVATHRAATPVDGSKQPMRDLEFCKGQYPALRDLKSLLTQEGVIDIVYLNLEAHSRRDLGVVALIGTCSTAAHCRSGPVSVHLMTPAARAFYKYFQDLWLLFAAVIICRVMVLRCPFPAWKSHGLPTAKAVQYRSVVCSLGVGNTFHFFGYKGVDAVVASSYSLSEQCLKEAEGVLTLGIGGCVRCLNTEVQGASKTQANMLHSRNECNKAEKVRPSRIRTHDHPCRSRRPVAALYEVQLALRVSYSTRVGAASSTQQDPTTQGQSASPEASFNVTPDELPPYIRRLELRQWTLYFYPVAQYLKCIDDPSVRDFPTAEAPDELVGTPSGCASAWEAASLVTLLRPQLLCLECCSSRLRELTSMRRRAFARMGVVAAYMVGPPSGVRKKVDLRSVRAAGCSGLLHAALLPVVAAAGAPPSSVSSPLAAAPEGGPPFLGTPGGRSKKGPWEQPAGEDTGDAEIEGNPLSAIYPIDRDRVTTARRLHECLLLQPTQLRALRACVLGALSNRWAWGPPDPVAVDPLPAACTSSRGWGALQWAKQQKELFPSGYQVLLEERASCAAASLWNAIRDVEARERRPPGGPPSELPQPSAEAREAAHPAQQPRLPGGGEKAHVVLVVCSAALLPLLMDALQQVHALEAPKILAAGGGTGQLEYRTPMYAALHRSPPCLLPLLVLRFVLLPTAVAYGLVKLLNALSSWVEGSLHRGDLPAARAAAGEIQVRIDEPSSSQGASEGCSLRERFKGLSSAIAHKWQPTAGGTLI